MRFFLIFATMNLFASCNGQTNKDLPKDTASAQPSFPAGQPKLVKTRGTDQYANIRCAMQDKEGNLWFGSTGEGVYRYDGQLFTQFTTKDGLNGNTVYSILQDADGKIWFGTDAGLARYDGKEISAVPIYLTGNFAPVYQASSAKNAVWSMLLDKSGKIWFGTSAGVYSYNGVSFNRFLDNADIVNNSTLHLNMVACILEDKQGNIWFGSGMPPGMEGLCRYDGKSLVPFNPGGEKWIRYMIEDKNGTLWIGTRNNGNWLYDGKTFTKFTEKENLGTPLLTDKAGNIWFGGSENENGYGGDGGIWRYDGRNFTNFGTRDGLGDYSVWCMLQDKAGHIWVGTRNNGLYRYDGNSFRSFSE